MYKQQRSVVSKLRRRESGWRQPSPPRRRTPLGVPLLVRWFFVDQLTSDSWTPTLHSRPNKKWRKQPQ